jgi:hypothetical protein
MYTLDGGEFLLLHDYQKLARMGTRPEQEIMTRHFSYFGPVPEGLLKQVNSENWSNALNGASEMAEEAVKEQPELRFEDWRFRGTEHDIWNDKSGPSGQENDRRNLNALVVARGYLAIRSNSRRMESSKHLIGVAGWCTNSSSLLLLSLAAIRSETRF